MRAEVEATSEREGWTPDQAQQVCGVDGCRLGWVVVRLARASVGEVHVGVELCERPALADVLGEVGRVFIDMPMGLSESGERPVDRQLRQRLGRRRSSVFSPPIRACLGSATYAEALAVQRARDGRGFSVQAWNLMPGVRLLDSALRAEPGRVDRWWESHPEWIFRSWLQWSGGDPEALEPKKTALGQRQRRELLVARLPAVEEAASGRSVGWAGVRRSQAAVDDLLDALALAVSAWESRDAGLVVLGGELDALGIPMRVVRGSTGPEEAFGSAVGGGDGDLVDLPPVGQRRGE